MRLVLILFLLLPLAAAAAPRPPTGLLAKAGPLPATIPLQVRAPEGQDYAVILSDTEGAAVISGYLRGGGVLRLLVPPGRHHLSIATGQPSYWEGPGRFFGDSTEIVTLPQTLAFLIDGNRRKGHAITLTRDGSTLRLADRRNRTICQAADWDTIRRTEITSAGIRFRWLDPELSTRSRFCD